MRYFFAIAVSLMVCTIALASTASIITRPGVATSPIKYYFDLNSSLEESVNHAVKVAVTASNSERTAVRFDSVQLFTASGVLLGRNVATETDALTATPYTFRFENFGVAGDDLKTVAGVQITFFDAGGDNPTGKVTVSGVVVSVDRSVGEECIVEDPLLVVIPEKPVATIRAMQMSRQIARTGGDSGVQGGGGGGCESSFRNPASSDNAFWPVNTVMWTNASNSALIDGVVASAYLTPSISTFGLYATGFGFSIPQDATIQGVTLIVKKRGDSLIRDSAVHLVVGGQVMGTTRASESEWSLNLENTSYGGVNDTWGVSPELTPDSINDGAFGVAFAAYNSGTPNADPDASAYVDGMEVKITYSCAPDSEGPNDPSAINTDLSIGTVPWFSANLGNIQASDDAHVDSGAFPPGDASHYLTVGDFSFSIPSGATISGIIIEVEKRNNNNTEGFLNDNAVRIIKDLTIGSTDRSNGGEWPMFDIYTVYGSSSDLWGETWTPSDINSSGFGFAISVINNSGESGLVAQIDHVRATIHYITGGTGGSVYDSFSELLRIFYRYLTCLIKYTALCPK